MFGGKTLYVGGSGPGNYTTIQAAINDASDGDTVFVYNGTYKLYTNGFFGITVNKSIRLLGENKSNTIICPGPNCIILVLIHIISDYVYMSGFSLITENFNADYLIGHIRIDSHYNTICGNILRHILSKPEVAAIHLNNSSSNTITDNNISAQSYGTILIGILLYNSSHNIISGNQVHCCLDCIGINNGSNNIISRNMIKKTGHGVRLLHSCNNIISQNDFGFLTMSGIVTNYESNNNTISENHFGDTEQYVINYGIIIGNSSDTRIIKNTFIKNVLCCIQLHRSSNTTITYNNFLETRFLNAFFIDLSRSNNAWDHNYWGRLRIFPKIIFGEQTVNGRTTLKFQVDWHPARTPFTIKGNEEES